MTRKLLTLAVAITMVFAFSSATAPSSDAQSCTLITVNEIADFPYYERMIVGACDDSSSNSTGGGGGGGTSASVGSSAAAANSGASATAAAGSSATAGATTTSLAVTGAESEVLGYVGAGLLGAGCLAAATARRRSRDLN